MKNLNKWILPVLMVTALPYLAFAESSEDKSDGCGLGWQVTKNHTMIATTTRGTTNGVVSPTYGMTSGTLGCDQHSLAKRDQAAALYAANNYESLSTEMAEGKGEYLQGFARTLGCNDASLNTFGKMTQSNYGSLSDSKNGFELIKSVKDQIKQNPTLSANCNSV